jgi:hypothetical protein
VTGEPRRGWPTAGDAAIYAEPVGQAAERIDPDVIAALARWRGIDGHDLSRLGGVLTTHAGTFAGDSPGYLNALHGFVAEQVVYDTVVPGHHVVLPHATTVSGWDIQVDGEAVQIKEGTHAAALVHEALERYPQYRQFFTDPSTAAILRAEGIDAQGVPGLEPDRIASETQASLSGVDALAHAGIPQLPILTTLRTLLRRWEQVQEGRLDAPTAAREGAIDIGTRGLGMALGLKTAAIGVVALGAYSFAVIVLPAAAIAGAFGLQHLVNRRRSATLDGLLDEFETTRKAAEESARIVVDIARDEIHATIADARADRERNIGDLRREWAAALVEAEKATQRELTLCAQAVTASLDLSRRELAARRFAEAMAEPDTLQRLALLDAAIEAGLANLPLAERSRAASDLGLARKRYRERCSVLEALQARIDRQAEAEVSSARREVAVAAVDAYVTVMQRAALLRERVAAAFAVVDRQLAKLGRDAVPARAAHG